MDCIKYTQKQLFHLTNTIIFSLTFLKPYDNLYYPLSI